MAIDAQPRDLLLLPELSALPCQMCRGTGEFNDRVCPRCLGRRLERNKLTAPTRPSR